MPDPRAFFPWMLRRTLWWALGTLAVGGLLELLLSGPGAYRLEVPTVLAFSVACLNVAGSTLAWALVRLFRK